MKYLCLISAQTMMEGMPLDDAAQHFDEYRDFTDDIRASGHFITCNRLQPPESATTIRVRNGKVLATDGPYAETKEQLGGILILEATDLNHAIQLMSKHPGARLGGCVDIPPTEDIGLPDSRCDKSTQTLVK